MPVEEVTEQTHASWRQFPWRVTEQKQRRGCHVTEKPETPSMTRWHPAEVRAGSQAAILAPCSARPFVPEGGVHSVCSPAFHETPLCPRGVSWVPTVHRGCSSASATGSCQGPALRGESWCLLAPYLCLNVPIPVFSRERDLVCVGGAPGTPPAPGSCLPGTHLAWLHKLFLCHRPAESSWAVGFLWLEPYIQGSSQTTKAAGASSALILDPWALRIAAVCREPAEPLHLGEKMTVRPTRKGVSLPAPVSASALGLGGLVPVPQQADPELDIRGGRRMEGCAVSREGAASESQNLWSRRFRCSVWCWRDG